MLNNHDSLKVIGLSLGAAILLSACSTPTAISNQSKEFVTPNTWRASPENQSISNNLTVIIDEPNWLVNFNDPQLLLLTKQALQNNYQLKAQQLATTIAKQNTIIEDASDLPELSLALNNSRQKTVSLNDESYNNNANINLQATYELDVWGKLSAQQQQANLSYLAAKADYQFQRDTLVADITKAWFNLLEAQQLYSLYEERSRNLTKNSDIIQSAYKLGLNSALDVYLTQNDLSTEAARLAQQQQNLSVAKRTLELFIADYPQAAINNHQPLPLLTTPLMTSLPASMLANRSDLNASWYQLLALDAGLAIAHKQRFPRIALTASTGDSSEQLDGLLSGNSLGWSLLANIAMPIFNAGRLEALEEQARIRVIQQESLYLNDVYKAFSDVENAISNHHSLTQTYQFLLKAKDNAEAAEDLSFNQYLKGLVSYTTVLESQRRAFDAQTQIVQIKNQLLQNRVNLHLALGDDFTPQQNARAQITQTPSTVSTNPTIVHINHLKNEK